MKSIYDHVQKAVVSYAENNCSRQLLRFPEYSGMRYSRHAAWSAGSPAMPARDQMLAIGWWGHSAPRRVARALRGWNVGATWHRRAAARSATALRMRPSRHHILHTFPKKNPFLFSCSIYKFFACNRLFVTGRELIWNLSSAVNSWLLSMRMPYLLPLIILHDQPIVWDDNQYDNNSVPIYLSYVKLPWNVI